MISLLSQPSPRRLEMTNQELSDKLKELLPNLLAVDKLISYEYNSLNNTITINKGCIDQYEQDRLNWLCDLFHFVLMFERSINHPPIDKA
jgi:hypothetical protein